MAEKPKEEPRQEKKEEKKTVMFQPQPMATPQKPPPRSTFQGISSDIPSGSRIVPPVMTGSPKDHIEVLHKKTSDKVAIVGFTESRKLCPYYMDKEWEIWGCNEIYRFIPRVDVLFETHNRKEWGEHFGSNMGPEHTKWLQENKTIPVYQAEKYEDIPMSIAYPWYAITHMTEHSDYINNQITVMVALAIFMDYKKIAMYGCEMAHHTELGTQRPSVEFFLGLAEGAGIEIIMDVNCSLLNAPYIYGLECGNKWVTVMQQYIDMYAQRVNEFSQQQNAANINLQQYIGAKNAMEEVIRHKLGQ